MNHSSLYSVNKTIPTTMAPFPRSFCLAWRFYPLYSSRGFTFPLSTRMATTMRHTVARHRDLIYCRPYFIRTLKLCNCHFKTLCGSRQMTTTIPFQAPSKKWCLVVVNQNTRNSIQPSVHKRHIRQVCSRTEYKEYSIMIKRNHTNMPYTRQMPFYIRCNIPWIE